MCSYAFIHVLLYIHIWIYGYILTWEGHSYIHILICSYMRKAFACIHIFIYAYTHTFVYGYIHTWEGHSYIHIFIHEKGFLIYSHTHIFTYSYIIVYQYVSIYISIICPYVHCQYKFTSIWTQTSTPLWGAFPPLAFPYKYVVIHPNTHMSIIYSYVYWHRHQPPFGARVLAPRLFT